MKILVTGSQGQLARALEEVLGARPDIDLHAVGRPGLDLAVAGSADRLIRALRPNLVINAAAFTAVDLAESDADATFAVNGQGAGNVAQAAAAVGAPIIHISTDYVFDGRANTPYTEDAPTNPINVYGASKLAGEEAVRAAAPQHLILRSSWIFSAFGHNFVKTMLRLAADRDEVRVVADQHGCPTSAASLASAIATILERWRGGQPDGLGQTYHLAGTGACTWADFAEEVFAASADAGGPTAMVTRITTEEFPTPAPRPRYSVLDSKRFARDFEFAMPRWQEEVRCVVQRLTSRP